MFSSQPLIGEHGSPSPPVVIVGAGAAGIGAGLTLWEAGVPFLIVESRNRIGGRAHTIVRDGFPLDLGCGWLHRAEDNSWRRRFEALGLDLDATPGPWSAPAIAADFPPEEQADYHRAFAALEDRLATAAEKPDRPASELLEPGGRWNALLDSFSAAYNGAAFARISVHDYAAFDDGETNWRAPQGYGAGIAYAARDLPVRLSSPVRRIEHGGRGVVRVHLDGEVIEASAVIVTVPTPHLADGDIAFDPPVSRHVEAARGLPLGCAAKVFLHLDGAEAFPPESMLYGEPHGPTPAGHHVRPFGRPVIETYVGGDLAADLERAGEEAFTAFAVNQIAEALGSEWRTRLRPLAVTNWSVDPWSRGAYSHALPGHAPARQALAEPASDRLRFAGEATSRDAFSSAHGAHDSGVRAAQAVLAALA